MTEVQITRVESPHSVKFAVNAKGLWSGEVKVYGQTPDEAYKASLELANKVENLIRTKNKLDGAGQ